ncbi:MAG: ATP-binding cassette domain-containing protein [Planctomycetaceae bacterium]
MSDAATPPASARSAATDTPIMIQADGLSKFYGNFAATQNVSFSVPKGEVCAFLGPNGAGKSTTMKLLTGYLAPSEGRALIGGHDVFTNRLDAARLIGYLPENGPLYNEMTPYTLLKYLGQARGLTHFDLGERLEYVAEHCSLKDVWNKTIGKLSRGYRQRVGMAHSLIHNPEVLILDEPTSGLDPNQTFQVRELIRTLSETKTILLSTHILSEVRASCQRVVLINLGKLIADVRVDTLAETEPDLDAWFRRMTGGPSGSAVPVS